MIDRGEPGLRGVHEGSMCSLFLVSFRLFHHTVTDTSVLYTYRSSLKVAVLALAFALVRTLPFPASAPAPAPAPAPALALSLIHI